MRNPVFSHPLLTGALLLLVSSTASPQNWPQWRGPDANGVSQETGLPVRWSQSENIAWKVGLPGRGMSTPIIWADRIFVTSQVGSGIVEARSARYEGPVPSDDTPVTFVLQCFRREDGKLLWEHRMAAEKPLPPVHVFHNLSTPSPVTDGERVYVWFGTGQLFAFTLDGKVVWKRNLAQEYSPFKLLWGHGSSPVVYRDYLILLCDHDPAAYLLALDRRSGKEIWKADRGKELRSYSTPFLVAVGDRRELIVNSNPRIDAYDPETGRLLWYAEGDCKVPIPMPVSAHGILYASRGYNSGPYMAIRPGGSGDVSQTRVLWRVPTGAPYVSSFLYYRELLYMATEVGVVRCIDPETGATLWTQRIGGNFSASPVGADGKIYLLNEDGETVVLQAGRECVILARNALNELCRASLAVARRQIFIRSDQHLYCIGAQERQRADSDGFRETWIERRAELRPGVSTFWKRRDGLRAVSALQVTSR
ncbi:MAG TPA: PQQ-binding-like beta-propeller repeat protein [Acidobacteriota bacterium]|jgi:outer membrane protein assembly factor BamB